MSTIVNDTVSAFGKTRYNFHLLNRDGDSMMIFIVPKDTRSPADGALIYCQLRTLPLNGLNNRVRGWNAINGFQMNIYDGMVKAKTCNSGDWFPVSTMRLWWRDLLKSAWKPVDERWSGVAEADHLSLSLQQSTEWLAGDPFIDSMRPFADWLKENKIFYRSW